MMKRIVSLLSLALVAMLAASCGSITTTYISSDTYQARVMHPNNANLIVKPLTAELKINEKEGKIQDEWKFTAKQVRDLDERVEARALCLSAEKHNADVIVGPLYNIVYAEDGSCTVTITGFAANYYNWRTYESGDSIYIDARLRK